jgi:hypothetical protein
MGRGASDPEDEEGGTESLIGREDGAGRRA